MRRHDADSPQGIAALTTRTSTIGEEDSAGSNKLRVSKPTTQVALGQHLSDAFSRPDGAIVSGRRGNPFQMRGNKEQWSCVASGVYSILRLKMPVDPAPASREIVVIDQESVWCFSNMMPRIHTDFSHHVTTRMRIARQNAQLLQHSLLQGCLAHNFLITSLPFRNRMVRARLTGSRQLSRRWAIP